MNARIFARAGSVALGALIFASVVFSQAQQPTSGKVGSMEWTLVGAGGNGGPGGFPGGGGGGRGAGRGAAGAAGAAAPGGAAPAGRGGGGGFPGGGGRGRGGASFE